MLCGWAVNPVIQFVFDTLDILLGIFHYSLHSTVDISYIIYII